MAQAGEQVASQIWRSRANAQATVDGRQSNDKPCVGALPRTRSGGAHLRRGHTIIARSAGRRIADHGGRAGGTTPYRRTARPYRQPQLTAAPAGYMLRAWLMRYRRSKLRAPNHVRLTPDQVATIKRLSAEQFGPSARVCLFGSRVRDDACGGDVDLMVEVDMAIKSPAWQRAMLATRVREAMYGRKADVVLSAPNLRELPIHAVARREGVLLSPKPLPLRGAMPRTRGGVRRRKSRFGQKRDRRSGLFSAASVTAW